MENVFSRVSFRGSFRSYQQEVLDGADRYLADGRIHIVAAPGSGKTVLGLELIRRTGRPTLILSPSVTVRHQWGERFCELFLPQGEMPDAYFSESLEKKAPLCSITYQALPTASSAASICSSRASSTSSVWSVRVNSRAIDYSSIIRRPVIRLLIWPFGEVFFLFHVLFN